jgi:hypothetical protein
MFSIELDEKGYCTGFMGSNDLLDGYIKLPKGLSPKIGQKFDTETMQWIEEYAEWKDNMEIPIIPQKPKQPTNAEVAQMISDLQADLIIAGVL